MPYTVIPDFNDQTRGGAVCSVSGRTRSKPYDFVFRLDYIDTEGFFDVDPEVVRDMAENHMGLMDKTRADRLKDGNRKLRAQVKSLNKLLKAKDAEIEALRDVRAAS